MGKRMWQHLSLILVGLVVFAGCSSGRSGSSDPFAGVWHVHTNSLTLSASGRGDFEWPTHLPCGSGPGQGPPPCDQVSANGEIQDGGHASLLISDHSGDVAYGVISATTDPSALPNGPVTLQLYSNDTLHLTIGSQPAGPSFEILCGNHVASLSIEQQNAQGINCGA
jgi:hypothetical protein